MSISRILLCLFPFTIGLWIFLTGGGVLYGVKLLPEQGLIGCTFGVFLFFSMKRKSWVEKNEIIYMICTQCKEKYKRHHITILKCPKCNGDLIDSQTEDSEDGVEPK